MRSDRDSDVGRVSRRRNPTTCSVPCRSLRLIWPMFLTLVALVAVCFGISYIKFMRTEIRA